MTGFIDHSAQVRPGEELDLEKLAQFLHAQIPGCEGPVEVTQFPSGYSNLTYLLNMGKTELVLRRPPFGNQIKSAHDMEREYRILAALQEMYPLAPKPLACTEDKSILGDTFYVMERQRGIILRKDIPPGLDFPPETAHKLGKSFIDNLAKLHSLDYQATSLRDLGKPDGYVERQVTGWSKRYLKSQTDDFPEMETVAKWLHENQPSTSQATLIHNDYKYDNLVLDEQDLTQIKAVLDWEMCTIGDPLMDLGTTLGYWIEAHDSELLQSFIPGPTNRPGSFTREELVERYCEKTGQTTGHILFYYSFGLFKLAVIIQQIYARYAKGFTQDKRFAQLNLVVGNLSRAAQRAIQKKSIAA